MYTIIIGAGKIGSNLIELAVDDGNNVVVIENNTERAEAISSKHDCMVINADATSNGALTDAGIDRADAVISTTDVDSVNIMVMLLAREHDVPHLVSVVHDPDHIPIFEKIGATLIENPQRLIASHLYHSVRYPGVEDFIELGNNTELIEVTVTDGAPMDGTPLADATNAGLPSDALVVALKRGTDVISPRGGTTVQADDEVTIVTHDSNLETTVSAFTPGPDE